MGAYEEPFLRSAVAGELTDHQLYHDFVRIYRGVYVRKHVEVTPARRAQAAALFAGPEAILTGFSAAALRGTKWIDNQEPAEVIRVGHRRAPAGMIAHNCRIEPDEFELLGGMSVATSARAAFDLGRRLPRVPAIVAVDALCNATGLKPADVALLAERWAGLRGVARLRAILEDVDGGAESPPETHTRLTLVDAGLPRPETQIRIRDPYGRVFARSDMGWRDWLTLVEYDGVDHWTRRQRGLDIERQARLEAQGWTVIRVGAELLYDRPGVLVARVRDKLRRAGAPV
ncbi:DUF559 domain-containing protein [Rhodococcus spongiicola]|uniref:DUF559 domain-containing protein n=1 Tax=Rhodococcus spongiicola TaxID=2487352 RepID=A0A3S3BPK6_9NOCA|nr:DUF559 domain-containing protein [Rhodococcus spongiicola]RVW06191.1 DUF559 domain-containing protein [Rhodococcus spongiicola]